MTDKGKQQPSDKYKKPQPYNPYGSYPYSYDYRIPAYPGSMYGYPHFGQPMPSSCPIQKQQNKSINPYNMMNPYAYSYPPPMYPSYPSYGYYPPSYKYNPPPMDPVNQLPAYEYPAQIRNKPINKDIPQVVVLSSDSEQDKIKTQQKNNKFFVQKNQQPNEDADKAKNKTSYERYIQYVNHLKQQRQKRQQKLKKATIKTQNDRFLQDEWKPDGDLGNVPDPFFIKKKRIYKKRQKNLQKDKQDKEPGAFLQKFPGQVLQDFDNKSNSVKQGGEEKSKKQQKNPQTQKKNQAKRIRDQHPLRELRYIQSHGRIRVGNFFQSDIPDLLQGDSIIKKMIMVRKNLTERQISAFTF